MAVNPYYDNADAGERFVEGELARGQDVDAKFDAVEDGFDLLPTENELKLGTQAYGTAGGVADAYTLTLPHPIASYTAVQKIVFVVPAANNGASTINVDAVGVVGLKRPDGTDLQEGDLLGGMIVEARYDGTNFRLLGTNSAGTVSGVAIAWTTFAVSGDCVVNAGHVVDNSVAGITMTLPPSPNAGDPVYFALTGGAETWTIARNGNKIMALAENMTVNLYKGGFSLVYSDATNGWVLG